MVDTTEDFDNRQVVRRGKMTSAGLLQGDLTLARDKDHCDRSADVHVPRQELRSIDSRMTKKNSKPDVAHHG